jgi:hypothetical protein
MRNSYDRWREEVSYDENVRDVSVEPPLFILGIWRSGTTHLQNLFALDPRFATPNWFQVSYPHTFLRSERKFSRVQGFFVPRERIQDKMRFGFELPGEDEFALCTLTQRSAMLSWVFPQRSEHSSLPSVWYSAVVAPRIRTINRRGETVQKLDVLAKQTLSVPLPPAG